MQTSFTAEQLRDPDTSKFNKMLRTCVHCGFCTATCPTFLQLGDELDSPRGGIHPIKDMLEFGRPATEEVARHIDRCLSCLSCMTTCPSGRELHAPGRSRPGLHSSAPSAGPGMIALLRAVLARVLPNPDVVSDSSSRRPRRQTHRRRHSVCAPARPAPAGYAGSWLPTKLPSTDRLRRHPRCARHPPRPRRLAHRLRASRPRTRDQRGHHPPADPPRRRGGGAPRRRLLRGADAPHGLSRSGPGQRADQHRGLGREIARRTASMPSSSTLPAAAPPSRIIPSCSAPTPTGASGAGRVSRARRSTSANTWSRIGYQPTREAPVVARHLPVRVQPAARPAGHRGNRRHCCAGRRLHRLRSPR